MRALCVRVCAKFDRYTEYHLPHQTNCMCVVRVCIGQASRLGQASCVRACVRASALYVRCICACGRVH